MSARKRPPIVAGIVRSLLPLNILELLAQRPQHGLQMAGEVKKATAGAWSPSAGTLYPMLQRMQDEGLISSTTQQSTGAPRRVYKLTAKGRRARLRLRAELIEQLEVAKLIVDKHLAVLTGGLPLVPHSEEEMVAALKAVTPKR